MHSTAPRLLQLRLLQGVPRSSLRLSPQADKPRSSQLTFRQTFDETARVMLEQKWDTLPDNMRVVVGDKKKQMFWNIPRPERISLKRGLREQ